MRPPLPLVALLSTSGCGTDPVPETPAVSANVLLVTFDTTRADHLGCYGGDRRVSPNLDRLAAEGVLFERAYATVPHTLPSHASLFTGEYPFVHGLRINGSHRLPSQAVTLAERLHSAGAATAAFPAASVLSADLGLDQGFEVYADGEWSEGILPLQRSAPDVVGAFAEWLDGAPAPPFFAWLHFFEPHMPLTPPADLRGRFASDYDAEVHAADRGLGEALQVLEDRGLLDDTWVCVTGDHGEGLGDHQEPTHGTLIYDSTMRVPLIFWHRSLTPRRVATVASLVDVAPTLLDLAGAAPLDCSGRSLKACFEPGAAPLPERPAYLESYVPYVLFGWSPLQSAVGSRFKIIETAEPELFDLEDDPGESVNLWADRPEQVARLRAALGRLTADRARRLAPEATTLDAEERANLLALGYAVAELQEDTELPAPGPEAGPDAKRGAVLLPKIEELVQAQMMQSGPAILAAGRSILDQQPDHPYALSAVGIELSALGRHAQAAELLRRLDEQGRSTADSLLALGVAELHVGRLREAAAALERCLEHAPGNVRALRWLGEVRERQGRPQEARALYQQLLEDFEGPEEARRFIDDKLRRLGR